MKQRLGPGNLFSFARVQEMLAFREHFLFSGGMTHGFIHCLGAEDYRQNTDEVFEVRGDGRYRFQGLSGLGSATTTGFGDF